MLLGGYKLTTLDCLYATIITLLHHFKDGAIQITENTLGGEPSGHWTARR